MQLVPAHDGQSLWLLRSRHAGRCTLSQAGLDGRPRRAARPVSCRTGLVAELPAGLLVSVTGVGGRDWHAALLGSDGGVVRLGDPQAHYELGEVTGDPGGRLAIVEFASYSPEHRLDLWLLDTRARRWRHLLGMPAPMVPKVTDVHWTADGRVVVLSGNPANPAGPS